MKASSAASFWPPLHDAELGRLLDRVDGVAAGIGKADDLGLRRLRLQQERREVGGRERMAHLAQHLAAVLDHDRRGVALERETEGVVGGEEEPGVAAGLHDRLAGAVGQRPGVVGPVDRVRRALRAGQVGGGGARDQEHLVLVAHDLVDRERDRGGRHVDDHVDLVDVDPGAHDVRADVRLVLMVGADDLDLHALGGGAEILDRHARGDHRALAAQVGIGARHVVQDADLDDAVGVLRVRRRRTRARPRAP